MFLLGVDIGTQGSKGLLCDLDGVVRASSYREHTLLSPRSGWAELDAERSWWETFVELSRHLLEEANVPAERVAGVGISACVPATLPVDEEGRPLRPAILYPDRRAKPQAEALAGRMKRAGYSPAATGEATTASPIPQLLWIREHEPEVFERTTRIYQCQNFLVQRLTGEWVIDHAMKRSYTPLYDPERDGWSEARAEVLDLDVSVLPARLAWAHEPAGRVTEAAARASGLAAGTPVSVGTADAFAEMVGAGVVRAGTAALVYSSFTSLLIGREEPRSDWHGFHCLPGLYFSGAAVPTGAALTRWFRDRFGQPEVARGKAEQVNPYQLLDKLAERVPPGSEGLVALPDFSGRAGSLHPGLARGALVGLTLAHGRGHIYRALLEGIAYELRYQLAAEGRPPDPVTAVAGGSASRIWTQTMSDILGITQRVLTAPFSAPFGDAYLAGMAAGLFTELAPLEARWIRTKREVRPDPARQRQHDTNYAAYQAARRALVEVPR